MVLKSALSYLWDCRRYFQDWAPALSQGGGEEKQLAVETLANSIDEIYNVLNYQLITISVPRGNSTLNMSILYRIGRGQSNKG